MEKKQLKKLQRFHDQSHRSYQPLKPSSSRLLQLRWDKIDYVNHRERVSSAKSTIDTNPPKDYVHIHTKLKKLQLEEERCAKIMQDNLTLLVRMLEAIRKERQIFRESTQGGKERKSLNVERRKQDLIRVMTENQAFLRRLVSKTSQYSVIKWQEEWERTRQLIHNISAYPHTR